jgi:hypothetical protein
MAQAYFFAGEREEGIRQAVGYAESELGLTGAGNPDVLIERHGLFAVDDARRIAAKAGLVPLRGDKKIFIIAANRLFHEAQNAMLKLFEEPPAGTTLVLVIPSEGNLLYTLRSRLQPLPAGRQSFAVNPEVEAFIAGGSAARAKVIAEILDEAKSDDDEEKQEARAKALRFAEGLSRAAYDAWRKEKGPDSRDALQAFLHDLDRLVPVLNDRSAPLKPILEHILIIAPKKFN